MEAQVISTLLPRLHVIIGVLFVFYVPVVVLVVLLGWSSCFSLFVSLLYEAYNERFKGTLCL